MRIDPRDISLDANERFVIHAALTLYANEQRRRANRYTTDAEAGKRRKDDAEMKIARAIDLLEVMS